MLQQLWNVRTDYQGLFRLMTVQMLSRLLLDIFADEASLETIVESDVQFHRRLNADAQVLWAAISHHHGSGGNPDAGSACQSWPSLLRRTRHGRR